MPFATLHVEQLMGNPNAFYWTLVFFSIGKKRFLFAAMIPQSQSIL